MTMTKCVLLCAVSALGLATAGCQTKNLGITKFTGVGEGAPYALRFTQYNTKIKWRVTSCGRRSPRPGEALNDVPIKPFTVKAEVTSEASFPDDPDRRWLLDLHSLDGWINTTDLSVTYENGRFKAFNATVDDKTTETVTAVAESAAKIAALAAAVGFDGSPDDCANLVEAADQATTTVENQTKTLTNAKLALAAAIAQGQSQATIQKREAAVQQAALKLADDADVLAKAIKAVTQDQEVRWPLKGSSAATYDAKLPAEALTKWKVGARWPEAKDVAVRLNLVVVDPTGDYVAPKAEDTQLDAKVATGQIPVRIARPGALVASLLTPDPGGTPKFEEIKRVESAVIQSGDMIYLPVRYRWPRSNTNGFGLDAAGYLTTVTHKQSAAPAQTLAKSAGAIAEQAAIIHQSPLEKLKAENAELTEKKSNAELKAALNPKPDSPAALELKAVQSEAALKKAQLELALYTRWLAGLQASP